MRDARHMNWMRTMWREKPERPLSILLFVAVMLLWEGAVWALGISGLVIPPPSAVARSLYEGIASNILITNTLVTFSETVLGFALGGALGLILGGLIAQFPLAEKETVRPEEAEAETPKSGAPYVFPASAPNVIV